MSNIIRPTFPSRQDRGAASTAALLDTFARHRRHDGDVFWMKENAEVLNILDCTGHEVPTDALEVYREFYDTIEDRLEFFPQYYRFLLSICLDLEALGLGAGKGLRLARWIDDQGLPEAELSDLQRAEAQRLLRRAGVTSQFEDQGLRDRLHRFAARTATFTVPNKKAAYELTHIVFYLSEYGRRSPDLCQSVVQSLRYTGIQAFLDCNFDLLAEVLVSLKYCGADVPEAWAQALSAATTRFAVAEGDEAVQHDDYHEYLVSNWALGAMKAPAFTGSLRAGPVSFHAAPRPGNALREMSELMFDLRSQRSDDWAVMRDTVYNEITPESAALLAETEETCAEFDAFFAGFARTRLRHTPQGVRRA